MRSAREFLESGKDHLIHDQPAKAIADFTQCIELEPQAEAYTARADAYMLCYGRTHDQVDWHRAFRDLEESIRLSPHSSQPYIYKSKLLYLAARHKDAMENSEVANMNYAIELDPQNVSLYKSKARRLAEMDWTFDAIITMNKVIRLDPFSIEALHCRATLKLLVIEDDVDKEIEAIKKINPRHELAYEIIFADKVRRPGCIKHPILTDAIKKMPERDGFYLERGIFYLINNQFDSALEDLNKAIHLHSTGVAYYFRGFIYQEQHQLDSAMADFDAAIEKLQSYAASFTLLNAYWNRAKIHEARQHIYQAACDFSNNRAIQNSLGGGFEKDNESEKYGKLMDLIDERNALKKSYFSKDIIQFNRLTDSINIMLPAFGSCEKPLPHIKLPQPLLNLAGFFVSQHRQQFIQPERVLPDDLIEQLNNGSFLSPAQG